MVDEIQRLLVEAWERVRPRLERDERELARRVERGKAVLRHPPRAWCLGVRGADFRLERYVDEGQPFDRAQDRPFDRAGDRPFDRAQDRPFDRFDGLTAGGAQDGPFEGAQDRPFDWASGLAQGRGSIDGSEDLQGAARVVLDRGALRELCEPIYVARGGMTVNDLASAVGMGRAGLHKARVDRVFETRHVFNPRGKATAILSSGKALDPAARNFEGVDERVWGCTVEYLPERLAEDFCQTLVRVPHRQPMRRYVDTEGLHPEHPLRDPPVRRNRPLRLPPVERDYVWYKWRGEEYVGYDWRAAEKNPAIREHYESNERRRAKNRERAKRKRLEQGPTPAYSEAMQYKGHRWLCPKCGKRAKVLYLPVMGINMLAGWMGRLEEEGRVPIVLEFKSEFGCGKCNGVVWGSCDTNWWNDVVRYLTCGLLYGREVEKPEWFGVERRHEYRVRWREKREGARGKREEGGSGSRAAGQRGKGEGEKIGMEERRSCELRVASC